MLNKYFIFYKQEIIVKLDSNGVEIPDTNIIGRKIDNSQYSDFGIIDNIHCYALMSDIKYELHTDYQYVKIRSLFERINEKTFWLTGKVFHLINWKKSSKYCGKCGSETREADRERAQICTNCSNTIYPRLSPAIIISVTKSNQILLGSNSKFPGNMYSVLAGFTDIGESLEECAKREVFEETGIQIKNIKYFGSQPWPFPDSLMIGFTADYESGEIQIDNDELTDAQWFSADDLPEVPTSLSISGKLIQNFVNKK